MSEISINVDRGLQFVSTGVENWQRLFKNGGSRTGVTCSGVPVPSSRTSADGISKEQAPSDNKHMRPATINSVGPYV